MEGETTMKDRKTIKSGMIWLLLSVLLVIAMVFVQTPARAAVTCPTTSTADSDGDGFTDAEECNGITLADGITHFPGYLDHLANPNLPRDQYLDPNSKDVFVILIPASQTNFPSEPLQFVKTLPITIHSIQPSQATSNVNDYTLDRIVSPGSTLKQKAVRLTEDATTPYNPTNPGLLGSSGEGTLLSGRDDTTIYTEKIKGLVLSVYSNAGAGNPPQDLIDKYIRHVIAHEFGHSIRPLAPVSQADYVNFAGYHYKSGTTYNGLNVILDQYVKYTIKGGKVTFYIGTIYTPPDIAGITLR